jgi:hypothetical protein
MRGLCSSLRIEAATPNGDHPVDFPAHWGQIPGQSRGRDSEPESRLLASALTVTISLSGGSALGAG